VDTARCSAAARVLQNAAEDVAEELQTIFYTCTCACHAQLMLACVVCKEYVF